MNRAERLFKLAQSAVAAYQRHHGLKAAMRLWSRFYVWFNRAGLAGFSTMG